MTDMEQLAVRLPSTWRRCRVSPELHMPEGAMEYGDLRLPERFWAKVYPEPNTGCWLWGASQISNGYGEIVGPTPRKKVLAHRWAKAVAVGSWPPPDMDTDHLCRQRACVNPEHAYLSWGRNRLGERTPRRQCLTCKRACSLRWARANQAEYRLRRLTRAAELRGEGKDGDG